MTTTDRRRTVWVLGDQLNRNLGALKTASTGRDRVLLVESHRKLVSKRWHVQRAHLVVTAMRRFTAELRADGFEVDLRRADSLAAGLDAHCRDHAPNGVVAMETASWDGRQLLRRLGVTAVQSDQFLCHYDDFAGWADGRRQLKMEDFYRWQRLRLDVLIEPDGEPWRDPAREDRSRMATQ